MIGTWIFFFMKKEWIFFTLEKRQRGNMMYKNHMWHGESRQNFFSCFQNIRTRDHSMKLKLAGRRCRRDKRKKVHNYPVEFIITRFGDNH